MLSLNQFYRYLLVLLIVATFSLPIGAQSLRYPAAHREAVVDDYHGTSVADPYRWLEQLKSPRAAAWLKAENSLTAGYLRRVQNREAIRQRLTALANYASTDVPWREAGQIFYESNSGLQRQPVLYSQKGPNDQPDVVLDPNVISPDGSLAIRDYSISRDGKLLAYRVSRGGADEGVIHIREISTEHDLGDAVQGVLTSVCWTHDGHGFFYVRPPARRSGESEVDSRIAKQVLYHTLGQSQSQDRLILEWKDKARWVYCMLSEDGRYAIIVAEEGTESELYVLDLADPDRPDFTAHPVQLLADRSAFHTPLDIVGNTLYVRTNLEAPKQRVIALNLNEGGSAQPRTVIRESSDVIEGAVIAGDRIVIHYLVDVVSRLRLFALDGQEKGEVPLPGIGAVGWNLSSRNSSPDLYYSFSSFLAPQTVYRYDLRSGANAPFRPSRIPFNPAGFETRQVIYTSKDGTRVPMFITAAKNLKLDGSHPTFLTGYGGYGSSSLPGYKADIPLWLEMGGVFAVANIRGGGEYGEDWHRRGMLDKKQNSFDDFIAAAQYLISHGYTSPRKLAVYGQSNGGLLVAAVITQRPELFGAAVANAGHYDMLRYHKFTVGAGWITEYGSPDDPLAFRYLRAYSPLHNIRTGVCYPATLLLAADHDDRVVPSHSYKFAAALQSVQKCSRPILLRVATDASHSYASKQSQIAERTDMWAFLAHRLGARFTPDRQRALSR